jgi:hypothetical protein
VWGKAVSLVEATQDMEGEIALKNVKKTDLVEPKCSLILVYSKK